MCILCNWFKDAKTGVIPKEQVHIIDNLYVCIDSMGDKPKADKFQPKIVIYNEHRADPNPPVVERIIEDLKVAFRNRNLWVPWTKNNKLDGEAKPKNEHPNHWYLIVE